MPSVSRRSAIVSLAAACVAGGGAGCRRGGKAVIGVISKGQAHQFWQSVHAGAVAASRDLAVEILWNGPAQETDTARQIQILETMTTRGVTGIAIAPVDETALVQPVERAIAAGIPVVVYDSSLRSSQTKSFVATDNYGAGAAGARHLAKLLDGKGEVIEIMHLPGSASSLDRERAFEETLAKEFPGMRIVGRQFGMADQAHVLSVAENLLAAHPNAAGVFTSTEPSSLGAVLALKARGLTGRVKLVAFDSSPPLVAALDEGAIDALVAQDPFRLGYEAVSLTAEAARGKAIPPRKDLPAHIITRVDLGRPEIKTLLFPELKKYLP